MDGLSEMAGGSMPPFEWDGTSWRFGVLKAKDWAEVERHIALHRPSPAKMLADMAQHNLPESFLRRFAELVYADLRRGNLVTRDEAREYIETISGENHKVHLSLRINHPGVTLERAAEVLDAFKEWLADKDAREILNEVEGMPEANPSSQGPATAASPSPGEPCSTT